MHAKNIVLDGVIVRGLGEGTFFMSMEHYRNEISKKIGFVPYPGTLNLKVEKKQSDKLKNIVPIKIGGYTKNNRIFGGASCYKAKIRDVAGSILVPDITRHNKDIIEIIAPVHLKSELKLKEGDKVRLELLK